MPGALAAAAEEVPLTSEYRVSGKRVLVFDSFIDSEPLARLSEFLSTVPWNRLERDRPDSDQRTLVVNFNVAALLSGEFEAAFAEVPLSNTLRRAMAAAERHFGGPLEVVRVYCNNISFGDMTFTHRDCAAGEQGVTALVYPHGQWERDWAGETLFFDDDQDVGIAIVPRPGRLVLFDGSIAHRGCPPSRDCYRQRYSLAIKIVKGAAS